MFPLTLFTFPIWNTSEWTRNVVIPNRTGNNLSWIQADLRYRKKHSTHQKMAPFLVELSILGSVWVRCLISRYLDIILLKLKRRQKFTRKLTVILIWNSDDVVAENIHIERFNWFNALNSKDAKWNDQKYWMLFFIGLVLVFIVYRFMSILRYWWWYVRCQWNYCYCTLEA